MKHSRKILLGAFLLLALQAWTGCIVPGGGGGGVWFHDDVWVDGGGRGWYGGHGGGAYVHPGVGGGDHRR
jgi:hypothetical protein